MVDEVVNVGKLGFFVVVGKIVEWYFYVKCVVGVLVKFVELRVGDRGFVVIYGNVGSVVLV